LGLNHHPFLDLSGAGSIQKSFFFSLPDLDHTHAAPPVGGETLPMADGRDMDSILPGGLQDRVSLLGLHPVPIDGDIDCFPFHSFLL
jgi:hypothetical protein